MSALKTSGHAPTDFQQNEALDNTLAQQQRAITRSEAALDASIDRASRIDASRQDAAKLDPALPVAAVLDATNALVATLAELAALAADPRQQSSTAAQTGVNGRTYVGLPSFS